MATNEINKDGWYLSVPVPETKNVGDPVVVGGSPAVIQNMYKPEREPIPGYAAFPQLNGFNLDGSELPTGLMPPNTVFASVAYKGVWAFEITGADTVTLLDPVYYNAGELTLTAGGELFGHVVNRGTDGRLHVRLASVATGA